MPKINITPELYSRFGGYYKRLKSKGQADFISWIVQFWENAYKDGYDLGFSEAEKSYTQEGINVSEDIDAEVLDVDSLREILLSVKGIGAVRADEVIRKITGGYHEENE